jgi:hypothetical protein
MRKLLRVITTTYVIIVLTPKVIKGACIITDIVARGIVSKLNDVLNEDDLERRRLRRNLRKSYKSYR